MAKNTGSPEHGEPVWFFPESGIVMEMTGRPLTRLYHIQSDLLALTGSSDTQKGAHGICNPSIFADHATHVIANHSQFDADVTAPAFYHLNMFGLTDERLGDIFNKLFHGYSSVV
jgi:hypothetical protein